MDQTDFSMDTCNNLIDVFKCIKCNEPLSTTRTTLLCKNGHSYSINDGYADFLESTQDHIIARTFDSFGYEWNSFDLIRAEDEEFWEENYSTNLPLLKFREFRHIIAFYLTICYRFGCIKQVVPVYIST